MFEKDVIMQLFNENEVRNLRQIALYACGINDLDQVFTQEEAKDNKLTAHSAPVELITLMGLANGSVDDLLLACHLQQKFNVDISFLMEPLCDCYKPLDIKTWLTKRKRALMGK